MYTRKVMLLQTNSYVVPKDKRNEHARLVRRFRQSLAKLGCEHFEVYEQVSQNWGGQDSGGRFVQIMRFRDRRHQLDVQAAERSDPAAQALIQEFCELINFPFQQQQGLFAVGFYNSVLPAISHREPESVDEAGIAGADPSAPGQPPEPGVPPSVVAPASPAGGEEPWQSAARDVSARRPSVAPVFFESTVAEPISKPAVPAADPAQGEDELDMHLNERSDPHLMNLTDLPFSEDQESPGRFDAEADVEQTMGSKQPAEAQDATVTLERAEPHFSEDAYETLENDHLEGHDNIEPTASAGGGLLEDPTGHPHMRIAGDDLSEERLEESDVELFEPEAPVSPFGN
jgi:hypothetical protein